MDPLWLANSKLRRGRLKECIAICDELLSQNSGDQAAWLLKCRATVKDKFIDDIELDEEGVAEMIMDENAVASVPRPGTSLNAPQGSSSRGGVTSNGGFDQSIRPVSQSGRAVTGFARPNSSRPMSGSGGSNAIRDALTSSQRSRTSGGTGRPMTTLGREVRLGTASLQAGLAGSGSLLVDVGKLNIKKYAAKTGLAMALLEYLLYVEHNNRKSLELCAEATQFNEFKDWYWKARLGKCYYKLGLFREAERQFRSSLKTQPVINTYLELCNVYLRLDLPNTGLDVLTEGLDMFPLEPRLVLGVARIHDMLNDSERAISSYKKVLVLDASNVEAIACLGAHYFYNDQSEMSLRYYRRLLQMGIVDNVELWNNIGLCCFYSGQYDMALTCFDRALRLATDDEMADVWYNVGHIGIALGDLGLAYQAFKVAISVDPTHGEALNNISILEIRRQKIETAKAGFSAAMANCPHLFEPMFNSGLMSYRTGDFQEAYVHVNKSLQLYPGHGDSKELQEVLHKMFMSA